MTPTIRVLRPDDDRSSFSCGDVELDRFLHQFAGQNQFKHHIGTTYVAVDETVSRVVGFATVAAGSIEVDQIPRGDRKKLPAYPLPILRLARLAIDIGVQNQKLGSELLRYVLEELAIRMADQVGCVGVVVDAYATAMRFYAKYGFVAVDLAAGQSTTRPPTTAMFLATKTIRRSLPATR